MLRLSPSDHIHLREVFLLLLKDNQTIVVVKRIQGWYNYICIVIKSGFYFKNKGEEVIINTKEHLNSEVAYIKPEVFAKRKSALSAGDVIKLPSSEAYAVFEEEYAFIISEDGNLPKEDRMHCYLNQRVYM